MTRAIVVGASLAGLVAARVLSDAVEEVTVVERDELPTDAVLRPGVPQAGHVHVLLRRGHRELSRLFPEFDARLAAGGAPPIDWVGDTVWITPDGEAPRFASRLRSRAASRPLFEAVLRDLVQRRENVRFVDGQEVVGLSGSASAVTGVRVRRRGSPLEDTAAEGDHELPGWLVVDASGRGSRTPGFLAELGLEPPAETMVDASLRYASRTYRVPPGERDWTALLVRDRPPGSTRGGGAFAIEGDRWLVTLGGAGAADHPPTDDAGFLDFARTLISPRIYEAIGDAEPLTPTRGWARTANRWRHAERMPDWPSGLTLAGDSLCALNPVYGQGMSVAAMEGPVLAAWLRSAPVAKAMARGHPPDTRPLIRDVAATARLPWFLAVGEDSRVPGVVGAPPAGRAARLVQRYIEGVIHASARDAGAYRRFTEVTQLIRPPVALFDPALIWRVMRVRSAR